MPTVTSPPQEQDQKVSSCSLSPALLDKPVSAIQGDVESVMDVKGPQESPNQVAVETKIAGSPCNMEAGYSSSNDACVRQIAVEERLLELETKLATLSRVLQQQMQLSPRTKLAHSPTTLQRNLHQTSQESATQWPTMPSMEGIRIDGISDRDSLMDSPPSCLTHKSMVPYLESPAPIDDSPLRQRTRHQRQRLSFHLLYDGIEANQARADDDNNGNAKLTPTPTMTTDDTTINNNLMHQTRPSHAGSRDNNNSDESTKKEAEFHPLKVDMVCNGNCGISSNISTSRANEYSRQGNNSAVNVCHSTVAHVAARVVDADTKTNGDEREIMFEPASNHSPPLHESQNRTKPTTSTNSKAGPTEAQTTLPSPAVGNRDTAAILPPLLLSKDKRSKWLDHLNSFQESNHDVDRQMQEFIKVPGAVEKTLTSGLLICIDSFLYVWTILPIRFAWSCVLLSLHYFFKWTKKPPGSYQFHRRHMYPLIQVSILLLVHRCILLPISIGKLYHWIRGQAMIKLYVLIAIVEVFDRLMSSLGQDCLDSLYWNTTRRPRSSRMLISVSVVIAYTAVHSLILFVHVATLNVAMNSADEALLALLIAGNFAEIKSTVFKKFNKPSLFKIVASDICERFKLALFLGLVLLLNFCQGMDSRKMSDYQRIAGIVWMSELLCDWLKHAFITKFNFIPSSVYHEYGLLLAGDVTGIGHEGVNLDHSHAVVKRIGFAQMPLVCVMARLVREAAKYLSLRMDSQAVPSIVLLLAGAGGWILLLSFKIFLGTYLQRTSLAKLQAAPELSQTPLKSRQNLN